MFPPCHAAPQQQQKREREMQIAAQNPYPEHSNATKTTTTTKAKKVGRRALHHKYSLLPLLSLFPVHT
jgi:hypothetical protein